MLKRIQTAYEKHIYKCPKLDYNCVKSNYQFDVGFLAIICRHSLQNFFFFFEYLNLNKKRKYEKLSKKIILRIRMTLKTNTIEKEISSLFLPSRNKCFIFIESLNIPIHNPQ